MSWPASALVSAVAPGHRGCEAIAMRPSDRSIVRSGAMSRSETTQTLRIRLEARLAMVQPARRPPRPLGWWNCATTR